jgi:hypothetical protein
MAKVIAFNRDRKRSGITSEAESRHAGSVAADRRANGPEPFARQHADPYRRQPRASSITASIVVPTKGRPQLLNRCIASLVLQRFDPAHFEIIVVDDGPSDDVRDVVTGWIEHTAERGPNITYIGSTGPHGPAAARNHGWRAAAGAIIAFTDDDTIARADWLANGVREFDDGGDDVQAVCGRVIMPLSGTPTDYQLDAKNLETAEFVTANCFCRKEILEELGGFDERFRFAWREDSDLHFRLLASEANIVHSAKAVMMHPIRPAGWGVSLQQVKKVQFDALLYKKHPALYRQRIRATPRWDFYLTVAALVTAAGTALAGLAQAATLAALIWFFMTARFCAQRLRRTSRSPSHVVEMAVTSALIPPLAVFWRAVGAWKFRVGFL